MTLSERRNGKKYDKRIFFRFLRLISVIDTLVLCFA